MKHPSDLPDPGTKWIMTWWILDCLGKLFHWPGLYIIHSCWWKNQHYYRICSGTKDSLRLSSHFIDGLLRTSSRHWIDQVKRHNVNIFSHNLLVMPHQSGKHKSLFVVLGANNIKDYMKQNFNGTRPCILHICPYATSNRSQLHTHSKVSSRIRTWLNALWRNSQYNDDFGSMPFTHRSMPMTTPYGKLPFHLILITH